MVTKYGMRMIYITRVHEHQDQLSGVALSRACLLSALSLALRARVWMLGRPDVPSRVSRKPHPPRCCASAAFAVLTTPGERRRARQHRQAGV